VRAPMDARPKGARQSPPDALGIAKKNLREITK